MLYQRLSKFLVLTLRRRGNTNIIRNEPIPQSTYQQHLDQGLSPPALTTDSVRFWSDYNRVYYHPRSIVQLHEYEVNSSLMPFERWETGEELFDSLDREHDLLDRDLRRFLEECDQMQAIQMITSADDAWGGFTAKYLERIRDDLGKTSTWVFGLEEGGRRSRVRIYDYEIHLGQLLTSSTGKANVADGQCRTVDIPDCATSLTLHPLNDSPLTPCLRCFGQ